MSLPRVLRFLAVVRPPSPVARRPSSVVYFFGFAASAPGFFVRNTIT